MSYMNVILYFKRNNEIVEEVVKFLLLFLALIHDALSLQSSGHKITNRK